MEGWIEEKLAVIDKLFPPERVEKSKELWRTVWSGKLPGERIPFIADAHYLNYYNDYNAPFENDKRLKALLDECILHGKIEDDFIPSLFPGCRQSTIPNMFGAPEVVVNNDYTAEKILTEATDIDALPEPKIAGGSVAQQWLDRIDEWVEKTDGKLPIHVCDMQGPIDAAAQMFSYDELFVCAYTEPDRFHELMRKVTDAFCLLWEAQKKLLGSLFIPTHLFGWTWVPSGCGASLSADSLVMISPEFFNEFFKPHLDRISDQFNGITIHSCGDFRHVISALQTLKGFKGINASQLSFRQLLEAGLNRDTVVIFMSNYDDMLAETKLIKQSCQPVQPVVMNLYPDKVPEEWNDAEWSGVFHRRDRLREILSENEK